MAKKKVVKKIEKICCSVILEVELSDKIQKLAFSRGMPRGTLMRSWVIECYEREIKAANKNK